MKKRQVLTVHKNVDKCGRTPIMTSMNGFSKLFGSIVTSTIWREDDKTRIVWVTMLAITDREGIVSASIPGLAAMANVDLKDCESALARLKAPDKYSRTKEHDGRRIEDVDGGWRILNYLKYREKGRSVDRTEYFREKKREQRQSTNVHRRQPIAEADAKADAEAGAPPITGAERVQLDRERKEIEQRLSLGSEYQDRPKGDERAKLRDRLTKLKARLHIEL